MQHDVIAAVVACVSIVLALNVLICLCERAFKAKEHKRATVSFGGAGERDDHMVGGGTSGDGTAIQAGVALAAFTIMTSDMNGVGGGGTGWGAGAGGGCGGG